MNGQYEVIAAGEFSDGSPAFKLVTLSSFTLHGVTVAAGEVGEFRVDENTDILNSWIFGEADVRNSALYHSILGRKTGPQDHSRFEQCVIRSCRIKASQMAVRNAELNAVTTHRIIRFFGAVGTVEENVLMNKLRYDLSVSVYNCSISEYKKFTGALDE